MVNIRKAQVDSSVVVGIIVVLAIVSVVGVGIYYFGFVSPRRAALSSAKESAKDTLNDSLATVDTSQARKATKTYKARIQEAGSKSKVTSIVEKISSTYEVESKREELLNMVSNATQGSFYTLDNLQDNLKEEVNSKSTLSQLKGYESQLKASVSSEWKNLHSEVIENISDNSIVMVKQNSKLSEAHLAKENALSHVQEKSWKVLKGLKFKEMNSYAVPVIDKFERNPTIKAGSAIDVYEYDYENGTMTRRVQDMEVLNVIYPKDVFSSVSWSKTEEGTSYSYSTDVWEEIKAYEADAPSGANSEWNDWASSVISKAREGANLGSFDLQPIYVVKVSEDNVAKSLTQIEQYQTGEKDIVLLAQT